MNDKSEQTFCPGCTSAIFPGQAVVGVETLVASEALWHIACRKQHLLPLVQRQIEANLRAHELREQQEQRRNTLRNRAKVVGAQLAGQSGDEGVFDAAGNLHELVLYCDAIDIDAELDAIERIVAQLENAVK